MKPKHIEIGVSDVEFSEEELVEIAEAAEQAAHSRLRRAGRRVRDTLVTVDVRKTENNTIQLTVDVSASGYSLGPLSYDELVEEAVDEALRAAEEKLRILVKAKKTGESLRNQGETKHALLP